MLEKSGSMSNPHDYRELMSAHFGYSGREVEDVVEEQRERHRKAIEDAREDSKTHRSTSVKRPSAPRPGRAKKSELDALRAIQDRARQLQANRTK